MSNDTNDSNRGGLKKKITDLPAVYLGILNTTPREMVDLQRKLIEMPDSKVDEVFEPLITELHEKEEMDWLFAPLDYQESSGLGISKNRYFLSIEYDEEKVSNVELIGQNRSPAAETVIYPQWVERKLFRFDCLHMLSIPNNVVRSAAVSSPKIPTPALLHKHLIWHVGEITKKHYHVDYEGCYPKILHEYALILEHHNKTKRDLSEQPQNSDVSENASNSLIGSLLNWMK